MLAARIRIAVPRTPSCTGNRVTAERWAGIFAGLGHEVVLTGRGGSDTDSDADSDVDVLVALHARRTFPAIDAFHRRHPERSLIVALTGTDLYRDLATSADARQALRWATRLVVLQPLALEALAPDLHPKARLIRQSTAPHSKAHPKPTDTFDVCVVGHLREVKDPFRTAEAARLLPAESKVRILHAGAALNDDLERWARREEHENPRYRWLGELSRDDTRELLARSHVLAHTSRLEGGANVMSEAIVAGLPVVSSRVEGSVGMLGDDHPAYFEVGDTEGLARLLRRCETEPEFLTELRRRSLELAPLYRPELEVAAWEGLLAGLFPRQESL